MKKNKPVLFLSVLLFIFLTACGQKGPLYLPDSQTNHEAKQQ
ncbi:MULTISPECIES: LPS translocon maturation chaperone LptM [Legionella]|uniref:Lipopeptide n=1 Tax=Legionella septentrionalis TaxID=2498109 RepID=A0A433JIS8_9GAMM|nr:MULTISPECIES: lipoprotein [Legionella]MCP0913849.1 lipoprotein [Legionella sp. 27cVA30]RUQ85280.1 hypothetical protein EKM59_07020 [Legionella septentrionalis]RUQ98696.1 hypothetical protein ELY11_05280 [Legionella septentrionalis]RUR09932.1 hypothetical protein ELY14_06965 [Legionella septentrionalis]RUR14989.1 hypothetical protein ELY10_07045 [Legionella septentrionalis]